MDELIQPSDILEVSHNHYREHRKQYPALPKSREGVHYALTQMDTKTSRDEEFLLVNNEKSGTIILSCDTNLQFLVNSVEYKNFLLMGHSIVAQSSFFNCIQYME